MQQPILIVSDVAARLIRRGLVDPADPTLVTWREARVLVYPRGPVVLDVPRVDAPACPSYVTAAPWLPSRSTTH
jgi:hypothetical protein